MSRLLFLLVCIISISPLLAQKTTSDQDAVRKVIEQETKYYFESNYDKWAGTWAHEASCYVLNAGPSSNQEIIGWENISVSYKQAMQNATPLTGEELTEYAKHDYLYQINGNMANATFKEGKGNFGARTLEKQNGEWKITSLTTINSISYKVQSDYNALKSFAGKWKIDAGTYKVEPTDSNFKILSHTVDIQEGIYGMEFIANGTGSYAGSTYSFIETQNFIPDYDEGEIKYFDFTKTGDGNTETNAGRALIDSVGSLMLKQMFPDKPASVQYENSYTRKNDGSMLFKGRVYNENGNVTYSWSYSLLSND